MLKYVECRSVVNFRKLIWIVFGTRSNRFISTDLFLATFISSSCRYLASYFDTEAIFIVSRILRWVIVIFLLISQPLVFVTLYTCKPDTRVQFFGLVDLRQISRVIVYVWFLVLLYVSCPMKYIFRR